MIKMDAEQVCEPELRPLDARWIKASYFVSGFMKFTRVCDEGDTSASNTAARRIFESASRVQDQSP